MRDFVHDQLFGVAVMVTDESRLGAASDGVERLAETLLAHLAYEEDQLLGPVGRLSIPGELSAMISRHAQRNGSLS